MTFRVAIAPIFSRAATWAFIGFLAWYPQNADSASSNWAETDQTKVRMIAGTQGVGDSREFRLGLHFQMQPGWKVYWRSPGDAGFPPVVNWAGPYFKPYEGDSAPIQAA